MNAQAHRPRLSKPTRLTGLWPTAALLCFIAGCERSPNVGPTSWNLVIVTIDTTRVDHLGCYGYEHCPTPTLDRLADDGVRYETCYASVPLTLPSHTTIMTGLFPFAHGVHNNGVQRLDESAVTLAEVLAASGYRTGAIIGAFVLDRRFGLAQGFETYDDDLSQGRQDSQFQFLERNAGQVTDAALAFLAEKSRRPFFLWVHYFDPHADYHAPGYDANRSRLTAYDAEIAYTDEQLARLVDAIDADKQHPTLLVVASDHGESLWGHGEPTHGVFVYNTTMHVPLIVRFPDGHHAGQVISQPVGLIDIFPSVLAWLGVPFEGRVHGELLPTAATDAAEHPSRAFYLENHAPADSFGWSPLEGVICGEMKLINAPAPELYDLATDPYEEHDLSDDEPKTVERLRELMHAVRTDPTGPRPLQAGNFQQDAQTLAKMQALGYLGMPSRTDAGASRPDPKDMVEVLHSIFSIQTQIEQGQVAEAAEKLAGILREKDPHNVRCLWLMAEIAARPEARDLAAEVLASYWRGALPSPLNFLIPAKYGLALAGLERYDEAAEAFRQALHVDDSAASMHINLSSALELLGRPASEWLPGLERAVQLEPDNLAYVRRLARAYEELGQHEKAQALYHRLEDDRITAPTTAPAP